MDIDDIYGGDWLRAKYLPQGIDVPVTISEVTTEKFEDSRSGKMKEQVVLAFAGKDRKLGLNKTNANMIAEMHGRNTDFWVGKSIKLYVTKTEAFGEITDCIRVRYQPGMNSAAQPIPAEDLTIRDTAEQPMYTTYKRAPSAAPAPVEAQWTSQGGGPPLDPPAGPVSPVVPPGGSHQPIDPDDIPF